MVASLRPPVSLLAPSGPLRRRPERSPSEIKNKHLSDLAAAFDAFEITDGAVLSFHHHYRNGDGLVTAVMEIARARGLKGITVAASSLFPVHAALVPLIEDGTIAQIVTDYMRGPLADAIAGGALATPVVLQSHGGRARAITAGQLPIDVAFVAAPRAGTDGTTTGRCGNLACGPLGYAAVDAAHARRTVVAAAEIADAALPHTDIPADHVDAVIDLAEPGSVAGIASGTTVPTTSPAARAIGELVAECIAAAGALRDGMSLQSGAGGFSLGAVATVGAMMARRGVAGSFLSGGITGLHVDLLAQGLFHRINDVQCFDLKAVRSSAIRPDHFMMTAEAYASPLHPSPIVNDLTVMLLGAVEIDRDFNVNVVSGGDGRILGGPGGHPDTAAGAELRIVTTELTGGGFAKLVPQVRCVSTPGADIDLVVTDRGIAVNPARGELADRLRHAGLPLRAFDDLAAEAAESATKFAEPHAEAPRVMIEARNGHLLDWV